MALWTIGDLHLSRAQDKPMDIFGEKWRGHEEKIEKSWMEKVSPSDTVVLAGDLSWAIDFQEVLPDLQFLHNLPGRKILLKGNHDYWWQTLRKMQLFLKEQAMEDFFFLQNNHFMYENVALCGTRGWMFEGESAEKMLSREEIRLEMSLKSAPDEAEKIVFMHFPPLLTADHQSRFVEIMKKYQVKKCFYGHLHGYSIQNAVVGEHFGINFSLVSADSLDFSIQNILR